MDGLAQAIGNTRLLKLEKLSQEIGASVYAKYEAANPGGSIKDRPALSMINQAEIRGTLTPGKSVLIESTSGNTGIALAMLGAARGYRVILTMPESMSLERRALLAAYGAELVLTPAKEGMAGAVKKAQELEATTPDSWIVGQFTNPDNPLAHRTHTAPEIEKALGSQPDYVVAGVGTGGTISGVGQYFKSGGFAIKCFAVEPAESPLVTQALNNMPLQPGTHGIQGIGANFIPDTLDLDILDGALPVATEDALQEARNIAQDEGLLVGISSGANIAAVKQLVRDFPEAKGKTIVTFMVDTGERYLSTPLFKHIETTAS